MTSQLPHLVEGSAGGRNAMALGTVAARAIIVHFMVCRVFSSLSDTNGIRN